MESSSASDKAKPLAVSAMVRRAARNLMGRE
jgi:hypothetical protein